MRTSNKIITMSLMVLGMAFAGCSDKKDDPAPTPTPTPTPTTAEYLTAHGWKNTALTSNTAVDWGYYFNGSASGLTTTDGYSQMSSCDKDDTYRFMTNGTSTYDEGATVCTTGDPQSGSAGTWILSTSNTILTWDSTSFTIEVIGENTLKLRYDYVYGGATYIFTYTFSKV